MVNDMLQCDAQGQAAPRLRRAAAGFTLVELLVAVGLTSIFLTMVATVFTQTQGALSQAKARIHMAQEADAVFEAMERDFASAALVTYYRAGEISPEDRRLGYFRSVESPAAEFDPPGPNPLEDEPEFSDLPVIYFVTYSAEGAGRASVRNAPEPMLVSYRLEWRPRPERPGRTKSRLDEDNNQATRGVYRLVRRAVRAYNDPSESGSPNPYEIRDLHAEDHADLAVNFEPADPGDYNPVTSGPLAFNVLWIEYRFPDDGDEVEDEDWKTWWPAAAGDMLDPPGTWVEARHDKSGTLPRTVEVRLHVADPELSVETVHTARFRLPAAAHP